MSENGGDIGAFMAGFVIGGLVGAATALILAPQSGEDTRAQIAAKSEELRVAGETQFTDAREKFQEGATQAQERARIVLDEGRSKISETLEKGKKDQAEESPVSEDSEAKPESAGEDVTT